MHNEATRREVLLRVCCQRANGRFDARRFLACPCCLFLHASLDAHVPLYHGPTMTTLSRPLSHLLSQRQQSTFRSHRPTTMRVSTLCLLLCILSSIWVARTEDDHAHVGSWEWAGVFDLHTDEAHTWAAYKVDGKYADAEMKMIIWPVASAVEASIHEAEEAVEVKWESETPIEIQPSSNVSLTTSVVYTLVFNEAAFASLFQIALPLSTTRNTGAFVIFAQHDPSEFEAPNTHYLMDAAGVNVIAVATESSSTTDTTTTDYNPGEAIGAAVTVAAASIVGLMLLVPG